MVEFERVLYSMYELALASIATICGGALYSITVQSHKNSVAGGHKNTGLWVVDAADLCTKVEVLL